MKPDEHDQTEGLKPLPEAQCYEAWFAEVVRFAKDKFQWSDKAIASIDRVAWREYFDEGITPEEAWWEEYQAAS